jgi:Domain of unknown function (DUF4136)
MKKIMISVTLAALALAAIASAQDVRFNFDSGANFANFKTYKWVEIPGGVKLDDLISRQLTSAVQAGLATKGLSKVDGDAADLYIGYQASASEERQINAYGMGGGWRMGGGMGTATTSTLTIGSISLDMYDPAKKELIWRGVATKTIDPGVKPDKREKNIEKGVAKLLQNYPPKKK